MAEIPCDTEKVIEQFGPHPAYSTGLRLQTGIEPDRLVKTHCCFCGQQCGIQLKVRENQVIGFEPWEDFPFNRGMLCSQLIGGTSRLPEVSVRFHTRMRSST